MTSIERPLFNKIQIPLIYELHEWEDEINRKLAKSGQAPIWVENWVDNNIIINQEDIRFNGVLIQKNFCLLKILKRKIS